MNMVKRSIEMKKPNTPVDSSMSQRKKSLGSGSIFHEANVPANTMIDDRRIIATDMPSTPRARWMLSGSNHIHDPV